MNTSALTKFTWHDGSVKNVHVDFSEMFEYQKHLGQVVKVYEDRVNWLSHGSKRVFGTVTEKMLVLILKIRNLIKIFPDFLYSRWSTLELMARCQSVSVGRTLVFQSSCWGSIPGVVTLPK